MKKLFSVLKYTKDYKKYTVLNILFNILFSILSVFSISLVIPFLELIFTKDDADYLDLVNKGLPILKFSGKDISAWAYYHMALMIVTKGKAYTLMLICLAVFSTTFLKNAARYFCRNVFAHR